MTTQRMFMAAGSSDPVATFAGVRYVAGKFGVSVQAVNQRLNRGNFPVPVAGKTVGGHCLWSKVAVDRAAELLGAAKS